MEMNMNRILEVTDDNETLIPEFLTLEDLVAEKILTFPPLD